MSNQNWELKSKKEVVTRIGRPCHDCKKPILPGSYAKKFVFKKEDNLFKTTHICEDCEKYYRGDNEPKM